MFLELENYDRSRPAAFDNTGGQIAYGELCDFSKEFGNAVGKRTLIFILSENSVGSFSGFVAAISEKIVPLLLSSAIDPNLLNRLIAIYKPSHLWLPSAISGEFNYQVVYKNHGYVLLKTGLIGYKLYDNLSLLLTTSGTTGSPKLVRHSYLNIESSAKNVASFFELNESEKPIASLPMHYTMGLSVITSHLYSGASILLMNNNLLDRSFWNFIREKKATSFTGVPYSYEILNKLRFTRMDLPHLSTISQGGGRLREDIFRELAKFAENTGRKFFATYGQTEGTARMAYLPADMAVKKTGSIGRAIPEGHLSLIDENRQEITQVVSSGEMVYRGPNVTLGYALKGEDLAKGDENMGILYTGDIARRDSDGCYYINGRKKRFLKLYGHRISLDEIEQLIASNFKIECKCTGNDDVMKIFITEKEKKEIIQNYIIETTGLYHKAVEIEVIKEIPRNEAGKTLLPD